MPTQPAISPKSPRTAYATRTAAAKPNIVYPDGAVPVEGVEARAAAELADEQVGGEATLAIDSDAADALRLAVTDAISAAVTDSGEDAAAVAAVEAILTNAALVATVDATTAVAVDIDTER